MFVKNTHQQLNLYDPLVTLPKYLRKYLIKSWAHVFQEKVFPMINEDRFKVLYSNDYASRPNTPANICIGLLLLKEINHLSDEELIASLHFDIRYQYALRTTSFEVQPVSANTLYNFRHRLYQYYEKTGIDLIQEEMEAQAKLIIKELEIDGKNYRMDSLMVSSSCKKLTRIALIFETNKKCINHIEKNYPSKMHDSLKEYLDKDYKQDILYRENYDNYDDKLIDLLGHSIEIHNFLSDYKDIEKNSKTLELIERLIFDQVTFDDKGSIEVKESKKLPPTSMHSPTDPDATYRTKYGSNIGYVGNVVEHFDKYNSIIEYYDYQKNVYSDISFSEDTIKK